MEVASSSSLSIMESCRTGYDHAISHFMYDQALFYAERLLAEAPNDDHMLYLMASACYKKGETGRAYHWLLESKSDVSERPADSVYLLAKCCYDLGKFSEGEEVLMASATTFDNVMGNVACGAAGFHLLGQLREKLDKRDLAVDCYAKALELSPYMWSSYERLSWLMLSVAPTGDAGALARMYFSPDKFTKGSDVGMESVDARMGRGEFATPKPKRHQSGVDVGCDISSLLTVLGTALHALHDFNCKAALAHMEKLPPKHYDTGYVLDLVGRAHFENADYKQAEKAYSRASQVSPRQTKGLEYYSTCLWHLRKEVDLGYLAHQVVHWDRLKPEVWCAVGNCFSLQKEHDLAIRFFKRAIQCDMSFTYAYTLCAHEFVANEKFDKAIGMYEHAISVDPRHYNAWWGLGNIYHRQEEYVNARHHFVRALDINKTNSVLRCYLGLVSQSMQDSHFALDMYNKALQDEPHNGMALFQKACVLVSMNRPQEALADLKLVKSIAPKEACVYFQLGRVYAKLGKPKKALSHYNTSLDLNKDSKDHHTIKSNIERLKEDHPTAVAPPQSAQRAPRETPVQPRSLQSDLTPGGYSRQMRRSPAGARIPQRVHHLDSADATPAARGGHEPPIPGSIDGYFVTPPAASQRDSNPPPNYRHGTDAAPDYSRDWRGDLRFPTDGDTIKKGTDHLIATTTAVLEEIASVPLADVTLDNVFEPHRKNMLYKGLEGSRLDFIQHVSASKELRDVAVEEDKKMSDKEVEWSMRKDVWERFNALNEKIKDDNTTDQEIKRYVGRMVTYGRRNGLHLDEENRKKMEEIQKEMSKLAIDFSNNISKENTTLEFDREALDGIQTDLIDNLKDGSDGKKIMTLKYPDYIPTMKNCKVVATRQAMERAFNSRCAPENAEILSKLITLRQQKAELLGYKNHADFITEMRMAKSKADVAKFLEDLGKKLEPLRDEDLAEMKKLRKDDVGTSPDEELPMWDLSYYRNMVEEKKFQVDQNEIQEYFPMDHVLDEMLKIYQTLLSLKFVKQEVGDDDEAGRGKKYWYKGEGKDEEIGYYAVFDDTDGPDKGELLGHFYLDLFPREGKFSHAAQFRLRAGVMGFDAPINGTENKLSTRVPPAAALVCNFNKATKEKPSLLMHREVETLFHEFGHCMHTICATDVRTPMFAGTSVERDFVECPSQMLENWCWEPEILKRMSKHWKSGESLPDDLIKKLIDSRLANEGINNSRQVALASYDQYIHSGVPVSPEQVPSEFDRVTRQYMQIPCTKGTDMPASWGHLCGYDAQYYGYLWAEVFSADMYESKFKGRPMDTTSGKEYRDFVLKPGGSIDATEILKNFLGREPSQEPFLRAKGLAK